MNPARSFGPAIVSGHFEHLWIYLVAPVLGMLVAIPLYRVVRNNAEC
jgi:aquaporin Z